MAGQQTALLLTATTCAVRALVNAIDSTGSHVALVIDTTTTRIDGKSAVPTVNSIGTGIAEIVFSSVSGVAEGTLLILKVNGTAGGTAFTEYAIPIRVVSGVDLTSTTVWTHDMTFYGGLPSSYAGRKLYDTNTAAVTNIPASITALNDFDPSVDQVTVATNNDKTGYSISGTKTTLDTLNDVAATDIVSGGAITTSGGAVSNVTTVATTTTNTDMRGTDNAFLAASAPANFGSLGINASGHLLRTVLNDTTTTNTDMRGTDGANTTAPDNASITAIKTKTDQLTFTVANQVDANSLTGGTSPADIYTYFTTGTNEDVFKADVTGLSTFDPTTQSVTVGTNNDKTGYALSSAANDAIGAAFLAYTLTKGSPGTIERAFWQSLKATSLTDGEVSGTPTASAFDTNLTNTSGAFDHLVIVFISGSLEGEARPIDSYSSTNGRITLQEALTAVPSSGDEFIIVNNHVHPISEIVEGVWSESDSSYTVAGTFGYNVDAIKDKTDQLTFTTPNKVDSTATVEGGDATAANQTTIIGLLTGATVVVSQSSIKVGSSVEVRQGMDYNNLDGTEISFTGDTTDQWPDLTSATVTFTAVQGDTSISKTCTVTSPTGTQSFRLEFTAAELSSSNAPLGNYRYYIIATLSSGRKTALIEDGTFTVNQPY